MNIKSFFFVLGVSTALVLAGCGRQERKAYRQMEKTFNVLIGCTESEVIARIGAPQNIMETGDLKIYQYHQTLGSKIKFQIISFEPEFKEMYNKVDVIFQNGRVTSWKGFVRR